MYLANAYPNSDLSAGALMAIAFTMVAVLAFWLAAVFLAARSSEKDSRPADTHLPVVVKPDEAGKDEHSEAGPATADQRHGAAA